MTSGLLLWLAGMIIGTVVFALPALRDASPIRRVSANPFITIPILVLWPFLAHWLSRAQIASAPNPGAEGLRVGLVYALVNALLDRVVVVGVMNAGVDFYTYLGPWLAYATLIAVPWATGRVASRVRGEVGAP